MGQDSEAAAEFVATVRGDHAKMKEWYNTAAPAALKEQFGEYPGLWKEVLNWPGWKEARREYLKHSQQSEQGNNNNADAEGSIPRKRKSRWGTKSENNKNSSSSATTTTTNTAAPPPEKRPAVVPPPLSLPGLGGLSSQQQLTPRQQEDLQRMQAQLRRVNERLDNLEREAARVDALPRGHRDRSPSPPPSKWEFVERLCWCWGFF